MHAHLRTTGEVPAAAATVTKISPGAIETTGCAKAVSLTKTECVTPRSHRENGHILRVNGHQFASRYDAAADRTFT